MRKQPLPDSKDEMWGDGQVINLKAEVFEAKEGHRWIQQGPSIICKSCVLPHAIHIGMDRQLVGYNEDGSPRIVQR